MICSGAPWTRGDVLQPRKRCSRQTQPRHRTVPAAIERIETEAVRSKTTFSGTQLEILVQVGIGTMFGYKSNQ